MTPVDVARHPADCRCRSCRRQALRGLVAIATAIARRRRDEDAHRRATIRPVTEDPAA